MSKNPDAIVNCYPDYESLISKKEDITDFFFINITSKKSINGGVEKGGNELLKGDITTCFNTSEFEAVLSNDSFKLAKIVNSEKGSYLVTLSGKSRVEGSKSYFGQYVVIDRRTNKIIPNLGGYFQVSLNTFFEKYALNN